MAEKNVQARIQHKHDTEANWNKATGFIPKAGELIIYDVDADHEYARVKIGDGVTAIDQLNFARDEGAVLHTEQVLTDEQKAQARNNISAAPEFSTKPIIATSTDGITYTATVDGLSELYVGCSLMIIPNMTSTSSSAVTLNVNNLGAVSIKRWDSINTSEWWGFPIAGWMKAGYPIRVKYTGVYWIIEGMSKTYATDLSGTVPITNGGTGATTAEAARSNLGAAPMYSYSTTDITAGTSALTTGQMHLVYE